MPIFLGGKCSLIKVNIIHRSQNQVNISQLFCQSGLREFFLVKFQPEKWIIPSQNNSILQINLYRHIFSGKKVVDLN